LIGTYQAHLYKNLINKTRRVDDAEALGAKVIRVSRAMASGISQSK